MARKVDLIVVGAGGAGLSAALTAAEAGLQVLVLEKQSEFGGATRIAGGSHCFAGTDIQQQLGIADSEEVLRNDLIRAGDGQADPNVVDAYVDNQLDTYNWMRNLGMPFKPKLKASPGSSILRTHLADAGACMDILWDKTQATGNVEIVYDAPVRRLIFDYEMDRVAGVRYSLSGDLNDVFSNNGVVLATGGFAASPELLERYAPNFTNAKAVTPLGNTGDGLKMAAKLGADIVETSYLQGNFGVHPNGKKGGVARPIYKGGIAVNRLGSRYVDESIPYKQHASVCLMQPGHVTFQIFDQRIFEQADEADAMFGFKSRFEVGDIVSAETLEELAEKLGLPPGNLVETVIRYNQSVDDGRDSEFGRQFIQDDAGALVKLETGPFYGYPSTVIIVGTYCGVRIDKYMRALDVFQEPIKGLYAVGEISGAFHGKGELPGSALSKAFIFGRLAAQTIIESSAV